MKTFLPLVLLAALLHAEEPAPAPSAPAPAPAPAPAVAESKPHAESAESAETKPHAESAESAESGSPSGGAGERSEPEGVSHAESAEPAAPGGAGSPSEPAPSSRGLPPKAGGGAIVGNDAIGGNVGQLELVDNPPPPSERGVARSAGGSTPCGSKHCAKQRPPLRAEVRLVDGSILKGALRQHAIPARSRNLGDVRVRLDKVESIAFGKSGAPAKIAFKNGDALAVRFPADRAFLAMDTAVGPVRIPFDKISSLSISGPPDHKTTRPQDLLYYCTFDDAAAVEHPSAGPNGRFLGGSFVPGKKGNALRTFADRPAAEIDFEPGVLGPRGTIEFWAKKEKSDDGYFGDSGNLRFFGLWLHEKGETPPWCSTHMQFTSNDGMGMSGLCGMINHCSWATSPSFGRNAYEPIRDSLHEWHHYAVAWNDGGIPGTKASDGGPATVQVFLDGKPVPTQGRQTLSFGSKHLQNIPARWAKLAFPTPSNGWNSSAGHVPFLIDEFKIWNEAKTDFAR